MLTVVSRTKSEFLANALKAFENSLTAEQKDELHRLKQIPDATAVLQFTAELDQRNAQRRSRCVASRLIKVLQSIQQYSAIADTFSQVQANITSLVWGSLKLTLLVRPAVSFKDIHCSVLADQE